MNYERMWFLLKESITGKNSHGKNELLNKMMKLEIEENKLSEVCEKNLIVEDSSDAGEILSNDSCDLDIEDIK